MTIVYRERETERQRERCRGTDRDIIVCDNMTEMVTGRLQTYWHQMGGVKLKKYLSLSLYHGRLQWDYGNRITVI